MAIPSKRPVTTKEMQGRLDRLRESANDSARAFRTAYTFYLAVALYVLVIVSSTDHELLFRAGDVQMPIVNVGVPVVWFFVVVPWLLVLLHFNLLIQATFLADKVSRYASTIIGQTRAPRKRTEALGLLYPAPLAHKVAEIHQPGTMRRLLNAMVLVTLAVLPPAILMFAQVKFLLYQGEFFTWLHRISVGVDIYLLWWLWPRIAEPHLAWRAWGEWFNSRRLKAWTMVGATALTGLFSIVVADFPGGSIGNRTPVLDSLRDSLGRKYDLSGRVLVVNEPSPEILAAHYRATCESETGCDESVIAVGSPFWCKHANPLQLNNRNFRYAYMPGSTLCGVNFQDAALHEADLSEAKLHGADLSRAELHEADLSEAKLHGADLSWAELHEADLSWAELHGAYLSQTDLLHVADLSRAELHGADLSDAELLGADLSRAELLGADLRWAELHGADLFNADFYLADLRFSNKAYPLLAVQELERSRRIINDIQNRRIREEALSRFGKLENRQLSFRPQSLKDAIICQKDDLASLLEDPTMLENAHVVNCLSEHIDELTTYCEKLKTSLSDLVRSDETGYIGKGIDKRRIDKRNELAESLSEGSSIRPVDWDCDTIELR